MSNEQTKAEQQPEIPISPENLYRDGYRVMRENPCGGDKECLTKTGTWLPITLDNIRYHAAFATKKEAAKALKSATTRDNHDAFVEALRGLIHWARLVSVEEVNGNAELERLVNTAQDTLAAVTGGRTGNQRLE